jgi:hypothetical protein
MIRLLVNNTPVDLSADFDISINKAIADIREPQSRSSEWTKTITIPGTAQNNKLFSHIFEVEHTVRTSTQFAPDFNPNKKASAVVLLDEIEQLRGFIRLIQINVTDSTAIVYECSIHGQTADLFTTIAERKLNELDFSEYNHTLSSGNVIDSWSNQIYKNNTLQAFALGEGYLYAMIDRGYSKTRNITDFAVIGMTPCLYAKTIVDKIFSDAGYSYTGDSFFNNDRFKRLIISPPNGLTLNSTTIQDRQFQASRTGTAQLVQNGTTLIFQNDSTSGNFDNGNNYNPSTGEFITPVSGQFVFNADIFALLTPIGLFTTVTLEYGLYVNGSLVDVSWESINFSSTITHESYITFNNVSLDSGDVVTIRFKGIYNNSSPFGYLANSSFQFGLLADSVFWNDQNATTFGYGDAIDFGSFLNSEVKQSEMLMSFVKMFNLYIEPDKDQPKILRCVPRDEFYNGSQLDWTDKLDYSQPVEIVPMGELDANPYKFSYKEGKDVSNQQYQENYQNTYGSRTFEVDNDFVKTEKKIEIIFSPTQIKSYDNRQRNFVLSYVEAQKDGDLRIFYYSGLQTGVSWKLFSSPSAFSNRTALPMTIHYDSLSNPTFDILFGMPKELGVGAGYRYGNSNLVTNYYFRFLNEITNKNSKIVRAYFRISPSDWYNLQFKNLYFFEGQYWRLNKVENYNPTDEGVYLCEFLLAQFIQPATITNKTIGSGTGGGQSEETYGDIYPSGSNPIKPGIRTVSVGTSESTGNGVFVGTGIVQSPTNTDNSGFGLKDVVFGTETNGSVALICEDFEVTKSETLYVGNYEMYPNFLSGGAVKTVSANYSATKDDWLILATTTAGNFTITLPDPTGLSGKSWVIKKPLPSHQVTIATATAAQIDGSDSHTQTSAHSYDVITTDGVQFYIISEGH